MSFRPFLGPTQPPSQWVLGVLPSGAKLIRCEANYFPPTNVKVDNSGATPPFPIPFYWTTFKYFFCDETNASKKLHSVSFMWQLNKYMSISIGQSMWITCSTNHDENIDKLPLLHVSLAVSLNILISIYDMCRPMLRKYLSRGVAWFNLFHTNSD